MRTAAPLVVLLLAAPAVQAAGNEARAGRFRLGPVFLTPSLRFTAGVDTNVFNQAVRPVPDTGFVLTPAATATLPVGARLRLQGSGFLSANYFRRETSERFTNRYTAGTVEYDVRRLTLVGGASGGQYRDRFSLQVDERMVRREERLFGGARLRLSRRLTASADVAEESYRYGPTGGPDLGQVRDALDRDSSIVRLGLRRSLTRKTTAVVSFEDIEDRFRAPLPDGSRRVPSRRLLAGLETGRRAAVSGRLLAGVRDFPGEGAPAYRGPVVAVEASVPLNVVRVAVSAQRDVTYDVAVGGVAGAGRRNLYAQQAWRVDATAELPLDLLASGFVGLEEGHSVLPDNWGGSVYRRGDRRVTTGGSLVRRFGEGVRLGGFVEYARHRSNVSGLSYEGWRYGMEATVAP